MEFTKFFLICVATVLIAVFFWWQYRKNIAKRRSESMVFLRVMISRKDSDTDEKKETVHDFREQISLMEQLLSSLKSLYRGTFFGWLFGQEYISLEYIAHKNEIYFYIVVPRKSKLLVEKQIIGFYPDCVIEETEEINIFENRTYIVGETMILKKSDEFPIRTYQKLESDSMNALLSALGRLDENTSATIQVLLRPEDDDWQKKIKKMIRKEEKNPKKKGHFSFNPLSWITNLITMLVQNPEENKNENELPEDDKDPIDEEGLMREKVKKTGFRTIIRILVTSDDDHIAETELRNIISSFSQFASPTYNRFRPIKYKSLSLLIEYYILRQFVWWQKNFIFNIEEIATLYHFPHTKYNKQPEIKWQMFRLIKAPTNVPTEGLYLGDNIYRGKRRKIYLSTEDRFRHFYVIGQTGTGKSSILSLMARQDLRNNQWMAVLDPHGDFAYGLLDFIPKHRTDDLVFFDPSDRERPVGLNLLEAKTAEEQDLTVSQAQSIMIKMFGPEIFGPRLQDYFANGCYALMDYPTGGSLIEIVKIFTDQNFQQERIKHLKKPSARAWWNVTYAAMGDRERQEMIPYFAAKFWPFISNSIIRNIIGQKQSSFDIDNVMDTSKILLASLSKGVLWEANASLLGLILVSKIQMSAMKRQQQSANERRDFFLYIDEFQNYITDSIESILSEARKYRLGLIIAHQYLDQLEKSDALTKSSLNLKKAIFGNVGSMMSYKVGPEDAKFLEDQFKPVYSDQDLMNMDKFQAALKLSVDGQPTQGFSLDVPRPWLEKWDPQAGQMIKQIARLKLRQREFVEKEILYTFS